MRATLRWGVDRLIRLPRRGPIREALASAWGASDRLAGFGRLAVAGDPDIAPTHGIGTDAVWVNQGDAVTGVAQPIADAAAVQDDQGSAWRHGYVR